MSDKYRLISASLILLSAALVASCATSMSTKGYEPLSAQAIKRTIPGNTLYQTGYSNGSHWQWVGYYRTDGTAHGLAWWNGGEKEGKANWNITSTGLICVHWNNDWDHGKKACFHVFRKGDTIIAKAVTKGVKDSKTTLKKGNPYKL